MQNFTMRPLRIWLILALSIALFAGCSMVRLGYNNGERLTYWWLNSYVELEQDQPHWVKSRIDRLFAWHRQTQLQDYKRLLSNLQTQLAQPASPAQVLSLYNDLKKRAWLVLEQALPDLADLALSLAPHQIAQIEKKFAANNEKYRKDHLHRDIDHRQQHRYKKIMKQAQYWLGDLSREQEAAIRQASDARPLNNALWMEERLRRQREMIALLKKIQAEQPSREATIALIGQYVKASFERSGQAAQQEFFTASRDASAGLAALIVNQATPEQRAQAVKNLQKWIDTFSASAGKAA